jgi:hypothetical protein
VLSGLDEVGLAEIGNGQKARIGGLVPVIPRVKFATKTRQRWARPRPARR